MSSETQMSRCIITKQGWLRTVEDYVARWCDSRLFSGSVLVAYDGVITLDRAFGLADLQSGCSNTSDTIFPVGCITKQFTAAGILLLHDLAKLDISDAISTYLPECPRGCESVTIHHLLTHTSGLATSNQQVGSAIRFEKQSRCDCDLFDLTFEALPGTRFRYSNLGYAVLGRIIEVVGEALYDDFVAKNIFRVLDMHSTSNYLPCTRSRLAVGHTSDGISIIPYSPLEAPRCPAWGSTYSTARDLFAWDKALHGGLVLQEDSLRKMFTPYQARYGYGWYIQVHKGHRMFAHAGDAPGYATFLCRFPDEHLSITVLSNIMVQVAHTIALGIAGILLGYDIDSYQPRAMARLDSSAYSQYVGRYTISSGSFVDIDAGQQSLIAKVNDRPVRLYPLSQRRFFSYTSPVEVEFVLGQDCTVTDAHFYADGVMLRGVRTSS